MQELEPTDLTGAPTWQWLRALYVDLVGRAPDPGQLRPWLTAALRGATLRDIARELLRSEAYCRTQAAGQYRALLDRDGEPAEIDAGTARLMSGQALQDLLAALCDASEYKARHPDTSAFVESLFQRLLGRASDPDGKAGWLAMLRDGAGAASVIRALLRSEEYCTQRVVEIHVRLLERDPQEAERTEHVRALMDGAPLQQLVLAVVTSPEYLARAARDGARLRACDATDAVRGDPDQDALALINRGDVREALQRLMQRHGTAVFRFCRVALCDDALADDVAQQVFIEAYRDLPTFARRSTVRTWLLGIARHRVLDARKQLRRAQAHLDIVDAEPVDAAQPAGEWLDDARLRAALIASIDELEPRIRTAILLRYQQGLTYQEMATLCGESPGTLQARVARALRRLRASIEARTRKTL